ncbi:MAG: Na+/H+ antiporter NhaC family protein [Thermoanaerobaculia bacterium]
MAYRGGTVGALAPFGLFLAGVAWLALSGAPDERGFWPVLLAALTLGLLLARDRHAWAEAVAAFILCAVVSTATGTSLGTLLLCAPLLYPAGAALGTAPAVLMGAILGGATFGDNISPVSDTTIASATTQGAEIGAVVRTRLRYALPAATMAIVATALLGGGGTPAGSTGLGAGGPRALLMLAAPALVLGLLLTRRHLLEGLLFGCAAAALLGVAGGLIEPHRLLWLDLESFTARGLVIEGVERGIGVSIFTLLLMGLVAGLEASGLVERLVRRAEASATSPAAAEVRAVAATSAAVILTTHSVVALLAVGPFVRRVGERLGLAKERRANLLDLTVCIWPFLLPYCIPTILASSLSATGAEAGMPRLAAWQVGLANAHSWALAVLLVVAVSTGYGRRRG